MDTIITIRAYPEDAVSAVDKGFLAFEEIEGIVSYFIENTELSFLNHHGYVSAGATFTYIVETAGKWHEKTGGFFDPSFAVLQKAYGFYDRNSQAVLPDEKNISMLLQNHIGFKKVLSQKNPQKYTLASGSLLDFGGIAGGVAIEIAAERMRLAGCRDFLIDDAGDIWFEGSKPDGSPWKIAVRDPRDNGILALIESSIPLAISTSGDYERFVEIDGKRYGHIMCPKNGRPVDYYSSVTVVASSAVAADVLSTAVFAMPLAEAKKWCADNSVFALILTSSGEIVFTAGAEKFFTLVNKD